MVAVFLILGGATWAAPSVQGTATGTLTVAGKTHALKHAYVIAREGAFDKTKEDVEILLTVEPVAESDLGDLIPGRGPRIAITVAADRTIISGTIFSESGSLSTNAGHVLEPKVLDAATASGRLHTRGPVTAAGTTFQYDVRFEAAVYRKPKVAAPSAAETAAAAGSAQARAYDAYLTALHAGDVQGMAKVAVAELAAMLRSDPEVKEKLGFLQAMAPKSVTHLRVTESGDTATLEVEAAGQGKGTVQLKREGGQWKVGRQKWSSGS
jgi:hypothetical protein